MKLTSSTDHKDILAFTDIEGRYVFERLASGPYTLRVDKPGFLPAVIGSTAPRERPLDLAPDQQITIDFAMARGGALEGRFIDYRGVPLRNLVVTASRVLRPGDGPREWEDEDQALTDDLGQFRLHSLPAGRYVVHTVPPPPASGYRLYFPGVSEESDARAISLATGENVSGLDVVVPEAPARSEATRQGAVIIGGPGSSGTSMTRVTGLVVRSDTGAPVPFANVMRASPSTGSGGGVMADERGRFEITTAAPDTYVFVALPRAFSGGVDLTSAYAATVNLKEGQSIDLRLTMPVPAAIEGRIVDEFGDPVPGMDVAALQRVFAAGQWRLLPPRQGSNESSTTDDRGRFRFFDLVEGDYFIEAIGFPFGQRGQGQSMAAGRLPVDVVRPGGFAPSFFPGTDVRAAAKAIHVREGDQLRDVVVPAQPAQPGRLAGRVLDETLQAVPQGRVLVFRRDGEEMDSFATLTLTSGPDGFFETRDLPRGDYVIQVLGAAGFGALPVTITPDSAPFTVTVRPARTARGRLVFDSDGPAPTQNQVRLRLWPTDFMSGPAGGGPNPTKVDGAWQFEISGMASTGVIRMLPLRGWTLKSVKRNGMEILHRPTDFQSADVAGLEVTLTNRLGSIRGGVTEEGRPARNAGVILFPEDSRMWTLPSGPIVTGRTDSDGAFEINDVLPGSYLAIAAPPFGFRGEPDPEWLAAHRGQATPIVITERQNTTVSLTLGR